MRPKIAVVRDPEYEAAFRKLVLKNLEREGVDMKHLKKYQNKVVIDEQIMKDVNKSGEKVMEQVHSMRMEKERELADLTRALNEGYMNKTGINKAADPDRFESHKCTCPGTDPEDPWAHRSKGMKCRTCCWFLLKRPQNNGNGVYINTNRIGRCRRHAPTMNGYPVVFEEDWCGDHKLDENKV